MPHEDERWRGETVDQQSDLLVDMQVERPAYLPHALPPQPVLGSPEQGGKDGGIIHRLEHAEVAGPIRVLPQVQFIDLRGNPPDRATLATGDPGTQARMLEKVVGRGQALALFEFERGDPGGVSGVDPVGQLEEAAPLLAPCHHLQRNVTCPAIGHRCPVYYAPLRRHPWAPGRAV